MRVDPAGAECRLNQWSHGLDVWTHHDHVARLEREILLQRVEDRVADHLDLPGAAVAGVDLNRAVLAVEPRASVGRAGERRPLGWPVGPDAGLDPREERARICLGLVMVVLGITGGAQD